MSEEREWPAPDPYAWELPDTGMAGEVGKCRHADDLYVRTEESPDDSTTSCMSPLQARKAGLTLLRAAAHLRDEEARRVLRAAAYDKRATGADEATARELAREQGRREERERWTPGRNTLDPGCTYRGAMAECHDVNCPVHGRNLRDAEPAKPVEEREWRGVHDYVERTAKEEREEAARFKSAELREAHADGVKQERERWTKAWTEAHDAYGHHIEAKWALGRISFLMGVHDNDAQKWATMPTEWDDVQAASPEAQAILDAVLTPEPEAAGDDYATHMWECLNSICAGWERRPCDPPVDAAFYHPNSGLHFRYINAPIGGEAWEVNHQIYTTASHAWDEVRALVARHAPHPNAAEPRNDHHLTWDGQCLHWCPACKANIRAGLNPDGSEPEAAAEAGGDNDCDQWVKDAADRIGKETGDLLAALAKARDEARAEERRAWELALVLAREECESLQKPADEWAFALQCVRDFRDPRIQEMERRRTPAGDPDPHPENDDDCDDVVEPKDEPAPEYTAEDAAHDLTVATGIEHTTTGEAVLRDGWLRIDPGDPNGSKAGRFAVKDKGAVVQWFNSRRDAVRAVVRAECPEATEMWPTDEGLALGREVHNGVAYTELRCGLWVPERADERAEGNTADDAHVHVYMHGLCVHCGVRQPREEDDAELRAEIEALRATHTEDLAEHRSMIRRLAQQVWCLAERCTDQLNLTARPIIDQASRIEAQAARKERGGSGDG